MREELTRTTVGATTSSTSSTSAFVKKLSRSSALWVGGTPRAATPTGASEFNTAAPDTEQAPMMEQLDNMDEDEEELILEESRAPRTPRPGAADGASRMAMMSKVNSDRQEKVLTNKLEALKLQIDAENIAKVNRVENNMGDNLEEMQRQMRSVAERLDKLEKLETSDAIRDAVGGKARTPTASARSDGWIASSIIMGGWIDTWDEKRRIDYCNMSFESAGVRAKYHLLAFRREAQ